MANDAASWQDSGSMDPREIVTDTAFRVDPMLLGADLASPWRRGAALMADLLIAAVVSGFGGAGVVATLTAGIGYRLLAGSGARRFAFLRTVGAGLVALCVWVVMYGSIKSGAARREGPTIKVSAVGGAVPSDPPPSDDETETSSTVHDEDRHRTVQIGHAVREVMGTVDPDSSPAEAAAVASAVERIIDSVDDAVGQRALLDQIAKLGRENEALKEELESPSVVRTVRGWATDFGLTLGWVGAYFTLFIAWWNGRTPGKRLFGVRVYRLDGRPISLWSAFERFAGYSAGLASGLLGFAQVFWDANRQAIHDKISSTVVVRMDGPDRPRRSWQQRQARAERRRSKPAG